MTKVLVVDDQPAVCNALKLLFEIHDIACVTAASPAEALACLKNDDIGIVIQDMNFARDRTSGEEGVELFRQIKRHDPDLPVLLLTAFTSLETAVTLVKEGATDYLAKPWDDEKLLTSIQSLLRFRQFQMENGRVAPTAKYNLCGTVYASESMHRAVSLAASIARSDVPVLITGPSGSGKEKLAEIIQANSARREAPFVRVNVGAIPDDLMESELFGAEPGAYTGSRKLRIGRFEAAHGGTLFLDEVGNLSLNGQIKLLRVLQSGEFERLGSSATRKVNVRILSATNTNLIDAIAAGRFREDLYFRLNVVEIAAPPLSERLDDILPLAEHFLAEFCDPSSGPVILNAESRRTLVKHRWPGSVRELRNVIQRAVLTRAGSTITPENLGLRPETNAAGGAAGSSSAISTGDRSGEPHDTVSAEERARLEEILIQAGGVVSEAASQLGISRQAFYRKMERLGITLERRPKG